MTGKVRLGISACLLGERVRYDGGHKLDCYLVETVGRIVNWQPVCPEVEAGLGVPREAMRLVGSTGTPRLVTLESNTDYTARVQQWTRRRIVGLRGEELCGFVFKSRSPSCNPENGIFACAFRDAFPSIPVEDEERLRDRCVREDFLERVFALGRHIPRHG